MILTSCGQSSLVDDLGSVCLPRLSVNTSLHDTEGTSMDTNTVRLYNVRYGHPSGYCPTAMNKHPDSAYMYNKLQIEQCFDHTMKTDIIPDVSAHDGHPGVQEDRSRYGEVWNNTTSMLRSHTRHEAGTDIEQVSLSTTRYRAGAFCSLCSTCTLMYTSFHMTVASYENAL